MKDLFHPDRLQKLEEIRSLGADPYPARAPRGREWAAPAAAAADARAGATVTIHGRVRGRRGYGKLTFLDLVDASGKIQACLQQEQLPPAEFALLGALHLGDFASVTGTLGRTRLGEPTVFATRFVLLSKALLSPPEKWHGLTDAELRARMRYVDLFSNPEMAQRFHKRAAIFSAMRRVFAAHEYVEVETPVLHPVYGGAAARPFVTHHNALDMRLYLRIAPELYLKRLLVGGIERVCEFARVFRNEGLSPRHNPEFTMLEFYEAYSDYRGMAALTEELLAAAAEAAGCRHDGRLVARFRGQEVDLTPPFPRRSYRELFQEALGFAPEDQAAVAAEQRRRGLAPERGHWQAVNDLFEEKVEPTLQQAVFVLDYPKAVSPLAKPSPERPDWAERWELFACGTELANAFSELNDPQLQLRNFEEQVAAKDPEAPNQVDWDYVRALAYGMPPAGGCGIGMDRLCMLLLGVENIREVILFPHLRPEAEGA
ncbi:MAG: lysine--tRNA ligase [Planctomycetota bacterium]|nr:MAG: lysine--tRNA ligase [Planctomycetota bacterium]